MEKFKIYCFNRIFAKCTCCLSPNHLYALFGLFLQEKLFYYLDSSSEIIQQALESESNQKKDGYLDKKGNKKIGFVDVYNEPKSFENIYKPLTDQQESESTFLDLQKVHDFHNNTELLKNIMVKVIDGDFSRKTKNKKAKVLQIKLTYLFVLAIGSLKEDFKKYQHDIKLNPDVVEKNNKILEYRLDNFLFGDFELFLQDYLNTFFSFTPELWYIAEINLTRYLVFNIEY